MKNNKSKIQSNTAKIKSKVELQNELDNLVKDSWNQMKITRAKKLQDKLQDDIDDLVRDSWNEMKKRYKDAKI